MSWTDSRPSSARLAASRLFADRPTDSEPNTTPNRRTHLLTASDPGPGEAWTFALDIYHPASLPADAAARITGDRYVLAHLERPGQASVRAMLAAAIERGHISTATPVGANAEELPVAAVIVMTVDCAGSETWEIPTDHALSWWIDAADFRTVTPERYFAAFPRADDSHDSSA